MTRLPPKPDLEWNAVGEPSARAFGDVYFSGAGGLAEADAVFLGGCGLPELWYNTERFAICELGFGTGLNVCAAWRAWKKTRSPHAILHISSIEACPLEVSDAARALARFPEVSDLAALLLECWPVRAFGPQRFWFPEDGFALTLHIGDAAETLAGMDSCFDAWFLDGFAPSRNPEMWSEGVFAQVARLSKPGARLATYSVAGAVRRGLETVGFEVEKKPGFGAKRERLEARFPPPFTGEASPKATEGTAAVLPLRHHASRADTSPVNGGGKRVAIIGAGIAGAACAQALVRRGVETIVLDAAPALGGGASGNPAGLVMPRLDRGGVLRGFFLAAYLYAVREYEALDAFLSRGVEVRAEPRAAAAFADLLADPPLPPDWFAPAGASAALHVRAGLVDPQAAIASMLAGGELLLEAPVRTLERVGDHWVVRAPDGRARLKADAVVLACGAELARFAPAAFLPIVLSRGQIEWGKGAEPARALMQGNYAAPFDGGILFGATFDRVGAIAGEADDIASARARNLAALAQLAPELAAAIDPARLRSRAALRASMPDFAPVAGLLPDAPAWLAHCAGLARGRLPDASAPCPMHDGLYILGGLGARGLTLAPLLGERIAAEMFGEPQMLSRSVLDALHPARFLLRALKRGSG